ncbi:hypothetical protein A2U01_0083260, partial [Trifolium medium]|nr:hypothetical protein [Trifolium medium]
HCHAYFTLVVFIQHGKGFGNHLRRNAVGDAIGKHRNCRFVDDVVGSSI